MKPIMKVFRNISSLEHDIKDEYREDRPKDVHKLDFGFLSDDRLMDSLKVLMGYQDNELKKLSCSILYYFMHDNEERIRLLINNDIMELIIKLLILI